MNKISKYFATNPKKSSFVKACQSMASQILGDNYDDETTIKTAEGIWEDYSGDTFDAKLGIFRNGLKGYNKTKEESDRSRTFNDKSEDEKYHEAYERYKDYDYSNRSFSITRDNETYYGQLIGTLLQSAVIAHLYHFQTSCRWCHADVEEYYENIVDLLDELCEGILEPLDMDLIYSNIIDQKDTPIDYFEELKAFCQDMKQQLFGLPEDSNYASIMDDIINLISKTLYRLKRFNYYKGESEQLTEGNVSFSKKSFSKMRPTSEFLRDFEGIVEGNGVNVKRYYPIFLDRYNLKSYDDLLSKLNSCLEEESSEVDKPFKELRNDPEVLNVLRSFDLYFKNGRSFDGWFNKDYNDSELIKYKYYSKKSFSDANGVKPAPQRFAVIFISKDHKLDCNASYKEADQEAIDCYVPEGGYGVLDGKKYLDDLELNRMVPKCDCEAKVVPASKVKIRGRIGHSSASL